MTKLHFDCFSGISGDMTLGALVDSGVPFAHIQEELTKLHIDGYSLQMERCMVGAFDAVRIHVNIPHLKVNHSHDHTHSHSHDHTHSHSHDHTHSHSHDHTHSHDHSHDHDHTHSHDHSHHEHRTYRDIKKLIEQSTLSDDIKNRSLAIFSQLAFAEGAVHGMPPEDVSFHEVGAIDSIVDIVGCAIGLSYLNVTHISCSPLPLGRGFVNCQHGRIPIPVPATMEMLQNVPIEGTGLPFELVTPTGAAIVTAMADEFVSIPTFTLQKVGYGAGTRKLPDRPNVLRVLLGTETTKSNQPNLARTSPDCIQIEVNLDDMTPELLAYTAQKALDAGALDVWTTPISMKKGRLAHQLGILCSPSDFPLMEQLIFQESSTLGFRHFPVHRSTLHREQKQLETPFGSVGIKLGYHGEKEIKMSPEYEDCRRLAQEQDIPLKQIYAVVFKTWLQEQEKKENHSKDEKTAR